MVMVWNFSTTEIIIKDNIKWEDSMERADTFGKMEHPMMETSFKVDEKVLEDGNQAEMNMIFILENTKMTKNQGKASIHGIMGLFTKVIS